MLQRGRRGRRPHLRKDQLVFAGREPKFLRKQTLLPRLPAQEQSSLSFLQRTAAGSGLRGRKAFFSIQYSSAPLTKGDLVTPTPRRRHLERKKKLGRRKIAFSSPTKHHVDRYLALHRYKVVRRVRRAPPSPVVTSCAGGVLALSACFLWACMVQARKNDFWYRLIRRRRNCVLVMPCHRFFVIRTSCSRFFPVLSGTAVPVHACFARVSFTVLTR